LDPFSVLFRYPGHEAMADDAVAAMKAVRSLRLFVRSRMLLSAQ
jgi:hypothetical protein